MFGLFRNRQASATSTAEKRTSERFAASMLSCPMGTVVDLSASGMSLTTERKPSLRAGQVGSFLLKVNTRSFNLHGRVIRIKRRGMKAYDIGVAFINPDARVMHILTSVARFGFVPRDGVVEDAPQVEPPAPDVDNAAVDRDPAGLYRLLGVPPDASAAQINDAFRHMARQYHPDLNRSPDASQHFIAIKQAHDVLRDADRRQRYDKLGMPEPPSPARASATRTTEPAG